MIGAGHDDSLTEAHEIELIRYLISDWHWGSAALSAFNLPPQAKKLPEVPLAGLGIEGDIDLLAFDPSNAEHAVAIQFKLAKISAKTYKSQKPNKLKEIAKLNRQTTALTKLGFWRTYSCVIVLIDSRSQLESQILFGGLTAELISVLESAMTQEHLHPKAGFVQVNLIQPPDHAPLTTGEISSHVRRISTPQAQSKAVTKWIQKLENSDA